MKLLLDTCVLLWLADQTEKLSEKARSSLEDGGNQLCLHQISYLEIQMKHALGKLPLKLSPREFVSLALSKHDIAAERLDDETIWFLEKLPPLHRDPFDRLLISHALCHGMVMVTPDLNIHQYPLPVLW